LNNGSHGTSGKKSANRLSTDGKWRSFPKVPHWLQYIHSGTYFARIKIKSKLILEARAWRRTMGFAASFGRPVVAVMAGGFADTVSDYFRDYLGHGPAAPFSFADLRVLLFVGARLAFRINCCGGLDFALLFHAFNLVQDGSQRFSERAGECLIQPVFQKTGRSWCEQKLARLSANQSRTMLPCHPLLASGW